MYNYYNNQKWTSNYGLEVKNGWFTSSYIELLKEESF
jgi:hypothetical protein